MSDEEIEKLYVRHEIRLGSVTTKTLDSARWRFMWVRAACFYSTLTSVLVVRLKGLPISKTRVNTATCTLHHRFGKCLAPAIVALATVRHYRFGHECPINKDGDLPRADARIFLEMSEKEKNIISPLGLMTNTPPPPTILFVILQKVLPRVDVEATAARVYMMVVVAVLEANVQSL